MHIKDTVYEYRLSGENRIAWHGRYHAHETSEFELHYFLDGSGSFLNHHSKFPIRKGEVFLTGPNEFHSIIPDQGEKAMRPISYYAVLFETANEDDELVRLLSSNLFGTRRPISLDSRYHFIFEEVRLLSASTEEMLRKAAAYQLLSFLFNIYGKENKTPSTPIAGRIYVVKALAIMRREVREGISVQHLASRIGVSEEYFIRLFKSHMRMTPLQYSHRLRVEAASGFIISTDKSIGEISDYFGFENQFHFSRIFKKCTGFSPAAYRQSYSQIVDLTPPTNQAIKPLPFP